MFKLATLIGSLGFMFSSWFSGFSLPRFTHGPSDYFIMPLFSYVMIIVAAHLAARIVKDQP